METRHLTRTYGTERRKKEPVQPRHKSCRRGLASSFPQEVCHYFAIVKRSFSFLFGIGWSRKTRKKKPRKPLKNQGFQGLVGDGGFEPPKAKPADLQSVPFGHSGNPPYSFSAGCGGAGRRTRTPDLLITNQLLYQLSYTSVSQSKTNYSRRFSVCQALFRRIS